MYIGHIADWRKLENFLREFFHPDRSRGGQEGIETRVVVMSPLEPSDDIKNLLFSNAFDGRVVYIIGSALSMDVRFASVSVCMHVYVYVCNRY